ncbi:MAG: 8-oxo-dGTP diphosphatase [Clostridia bacterium]|nr:8-oxo-dGTP diphosphatase [Clostridia bacterium]
MKLTTLCYIQNGTTWLMLHRTKKDHDENEGKWIGVGGKLEAGESPEDCLYREVTEETGLVLTSHRFRGVVTFISDVWDDEMMFLYTSDSYKGKFKECDEGVLHWVEQSDIPNLKLWEGDKLFIDLLIKDQPFFSLKLVYEGEKLSSAYLDGRKI